MSCSSVVHRSLGCSQRAREDREAGEPSRADMQLRNPQQEEKKEEYQQTRVTVPADTTSTYARVLEECTCKHDVSYAVCTNFKGVYAHEVGLGVPMPLL